MVNSTAVMRRLLRRAKNALLAMTMISELNCVKKYGNNCKDTGQRVFANERLDPGKEIQVRLSSKQKELVYVLFHPP
jgi:hypothetical protein